MQNMKEKDKFDFKSLFFVLLCILLFVGIIALGGWIAHTFLGIEW